MGYYYTGEPETAMPPKSWAMPKTHTPASPVKERGLRYYQSEVGMWLSRDPIEEKGGLNLYVHTLNSPISFFDPDGRAAEKKNWYTDGFEVWAEEFLTGAPPWHKGGNMRGGTRANIPRVDMEIETGCPSGQGCVHLTLLSVTERCDTWWSALNRNAELHEARHVDDFHRITFVPTRTYAENVQKCYDTEQDAECWQTVAESVVPLLYYYMGVLAGLQLDGETASAALLQEKIKNIEQQLQSAENQCRNHQ